MLKLGVSANKHYGQCEDKLNFISYGQNLLKDKQYTLPRWIMAGTGNTGIVWHFWEFTCSELRMRRLVPLSCVANTQSWKQVQLLCQSTSKVHPLKLISFVTSKMQNARAAVCCFMGV